MTVVYGVMTSEPLIKKIALYGGLCLGLLTVSTAAWSAELTSTQTQSDEGYMMLTINQACGAQPETNLVEQLQAVHNLSQKPSALGFQGLIKVLDSSYPLARRKAARALIDIWPKLPSQTKDTTGWTPQVSRFLSDKDWVVQKNMIRLLAMMRNPQAQQALNGFFKSSSQVNQQFLLADLKVDTTQPVVITLVKTAMAQSPHTAIRQQAKAALSH